jgi:MFS family permease
VNFFRRLPGLARLAGVLDRSLATLAGNALTGAQVARLRWFWLDGFFGTVSGSFYGSFVPLFAVAYGATNAQVGQLSGIASLAGLAALLPGAQAVKLFGGRRKGLVVLFGGIIVRVMLLAWLLLPFFVRNPSAAIAVIIAINAVIALCNSFANPAWTAIVADIVPREIRGRFFSHRSLAINLPALLVVPLAGLLIQAGSRPGTPFAGYQVVFALAIVSGAVGTYCFHKIDDPVLPSHASQKLPLRDGEPVHPPRAWFHQPAGWHANLELWRAGDRSVSECLPGEEPGLQHCPGRLGGRGRQPDGRPHPGLAGPLGRPARQHLCPGLPVVDHPLPATGLDDGHQWLAGGGHQRLRRHIMGRPRPGQLQPAAGYGAAEARAESYALFQIVIAASATVAPLLGGRLADAFGFPPIFILSCMLRFVGAGVFLWWVARPALRRKHPPTEAPNLAG